MTVPRGGAAAVRVSLVALVVSVLVACGGGGFTGGDVEEFGSFRIDVTNDTYPTGAVIHLEPEGASAQELGDVPVEATTTFRIEPDDPSGEHRLRAVIPGGDEILSDPFVPSESPGLTWDIGQNVLTLEDPGA